MHSKVRKEIKNSSRSSDEVSYVPPRYLAMHGPSDSLSLTLKSRICPVLQALLAIPSLELQNSTWQSGSGPASSTFPQTNTPVRHLDPKQFCWKRLMKIRSGNLALLNRDLIVMGQKGSRYVPRDTKIELSLRGNGNRCLFCSSQTKTEFLIPSLR